ncbi:FACT complex subunit spt16 [Zancudomyces culisetae]|uniref:FACT complex subunit n=1 Tax=Zancudomyces culisetae TaxID=1213189 RepID=A0A1R1PMG1_ZANCU|nr:FACT complex subunit spt16 [Zancudomyces culisetae]|eukprot:OMH82129.1 FACT complex subunit spt16 [Zancudomyces culisetae]
MVDQRHESILVPINGVAVPFNIRTLKNISKSDEGETTFLRLNFITPGAGAAVASNKQELSFIRSLTFKSSDILRFSELYNEINALKKDQVKREQEKSTMADIVEQDKLIEVRNTRPTRLADVFIRPGPDNKRIPGGLEIHKNGLRYVHPVRQHSVDLLFNNIKHMIFQPSKHELVVLLHFHLKNPIMLGKKKVYDVQFCKEVSDSAFDETGNRKRRFTRYGDEDEIQAEIDERINRDRLDKLFKAFAEAVAEQSNNLIDLDIPFYDASFMGVPLRSRVRLQPTVDCLVHLSDPPFFLVSISDIELVHLERVQFGLKNFDFVIVFKDYKKTPVHVNTVPIEQLDDVKEWLDSVNIPFSEGPVNLNWSQIMKTINDSPRDFFLDGGWSFLGDTPLSDDENDSPSESEFELDEDEDNDQSSDDYSDSDDDGDAYSSDESESTPDDDDDEEEGDDWDTLDRKARQYDERHTRGNFFAPTNKRAKVSNSSADSNRRPPPKKSFSRR